MAPRDHYLISAQHPIRFARVLGGQIGAPASPLEGKETFGLAQSGVDRAFCCTGIHNASDPELITASMVPTPSAS
jgi:hypothetical protein